MKTSLRGVIKKDSNILQFMLRFTNNDSENDNLADKSRLHGAGGGYYLRVDR